MDLKKAETSWFHMNALYPLHCTQCACCQLPI